MKPTLIIQVGIQRISKITSLLESVHISNEWKPHYKRIKESPRLRETWSSSPFDLYLLILTILLNFLIFNSCKYKQQIQEKRMWGLKCCLHHKGEAIDIGTTL